MKLDPYLWGFYLVVAYLFLKLEEILFFGFTKFFQLGEGRVLVFHLSFQGFIIFMDPEKVPHFSEPPITSLIK